MSADPNNDLSHSSLPVLKWSSQDAFNSLQQVSENVTQSAKEAIEWYVTAKNKKKRYARSIRILSIVLATIAALLPTFGELLQNSDGTIRIPAGWSTILLGVAGALLLLDRFFGYSTGWIRYITAELQLRQITQEFEPDWEAEIASWEGHSPSREHVLQMMARSKTFITQVNTIVREETNAWVQEFESALKQVDESSKSKPAYNEPGALNIIVTNGSITEDGWNLVVNNGAGEKYKGNTAGKRNMLPGRHQIKIIGQIGGKVVQAEKVIQVPVGGTCEETLTLN